MAAAVFRGLTIAAAVLLTQIAANAPKTRMHTVKEIRFDGKAVTSAAATVTFGDGKVESRLQQGETIGDGTRVDVPAQLVVVIVSTGGASTATLEPGASVTFVSTAQGELLRSNAGKTFFDVVHNSLNFFRVQYGEQITAGVSGTAFSIDATDTTVTFTCTSDAVNISKSGYLLIGGVAKSVSLIDVISAGRNAQVSYQPQATWYLAKFANYAEALAFYQDRLSAAKASGDTNAETAALRNVGSIEFAQGSYEDALGSRAQALALDQRLGDRESEARDLLGIGNVARAQGRDFDALQSDQQALALFRDLGDRQGEAAELGFIGSIKWNPQNRYADALQLYQQALTLFRQLGDRSGEARILNARGLVETTLGAGADYRKAHQQALSFYGQALQSHQQALAIFQELGDRGNEAAALRYIGILERYQGRYSDALQSVQQSLALDRDLGARVDEAEALKYIGVIEASQGSYADALQAHQQALAVFRESDDRAGEASSLDGIGWDQWHLGRSAEALESYREAFALFQQLGDQPFMARATRNIGQITAGKPPDWPPR